VVNGRGELARVTGVSSSSSSRWVPQYTVIRGLERGEEIHDTWNGDFMKRAPAGAKKRSPFATKR
jgi:hypothetical protein